MFETYTAEVGYGSTLEGTNLDQDSKIPGEHPPSQEMNEEEFEEQVLNGRSLGENSQQAIIQHFNLE